jgi:hypothetical protein
MFMTGYTLYLTFPPIFNSSLTQVTVNGKVGVFASIGGGEKTLAISARGDN